MLSSVLMPNKMYSVRIVNMVYRFTFLMTNLVCLCTSALYRLLTALDDDMDEATESMNFVMGRLGKLLKTKSEWFDSGNSS